MNTSSAGDSTLTPNPDTIYLMPFFSTKDGPMVVEIRQPIPARSWIPGRCRWRM
jgi:hypothetical protein